MIVVDDLRPDFGCYGNKLVYSPNLDALAARGTVFNRAYCQHAMCSPSRSAMMTGRRPDSTRVYDLLLHFRANLPDTVTLPQQFRRFGYQTSGFSKVFHGLLDDSLSWSTPSWKPEGPGWGTAENAQRAQDLDDQLRLWGWRAPDIESGSGVSWSMLDMRDEETPDGRTATSAIHAMYAWRNWPFFLSVGFRKPHLPFAVPKKYYDLYPESRVGLMPRDLAAVPRNAPSDALHDLEELRQYNDIPDSGPIPESKALELIRGYYASVSFVDAQIGRLLAALDALGLRERTIVVVTSDHGFQLGDHTIWTKHTNFDRAVRVPLIVSAPGQTSQGATSPAIVETVDIYPTVCDLARLPKPAGLEGTSFVPLLADPARPWKSAAFSQFSRAVPFVDRSMGYSVRTSRFRLTEWRAAPLGTLPSPSTPPGSSLRGLELYDYQIDPRESVNLAGERAYSSVVSSMTSLLRAGWTYALPPA